MFISLKARNYRMKCKDSGELYQLCLKKFRSAYKSDPAYQNLKRVFKEHFTVAHKKVHVKDTTELTSSSLQSPDDVESTFREKNGQKAPGSCC